MTKESDGTVDGMAQAAVQLSVIAMDAACQSDPLQTARRITELATKLIPCVAADIVRPGAGGILRVTASSDQAVTAQLLAALHKWPHDPYPRTQSDRARLQAHHPVEYLRQVRQRVAVMDELTF